MPNNVIPPVVIWAPAILAAVVSVPSSAQEVAAETAAAELRQLLADAWEYNLRENPLLATRVGDPRFNDRLPKVSVADARRRAARKRKFLDRLESIQRPALDEADQINYRMFRRVLRDEISDYEFQSHLIPITNREGFHIRFPDLRTTSPLESTRDYENYIARLRKFREFAQAHINIMRVGVERGFTLPSVVLEGYRQPIETHIVQEPKNSLFYEPLRNIPSTVPDADQDRLRTEARQAIRTSIVPGYEAFLAFMQDEYVPQARGSIAASALPDGRDYYRHCVKKYTTLPLGPEEVHATGLAEVARIRAEMQQIIDRLGFDGDFADFLDHLRNSERFYARTPEELLKATALVLKRMDGQLPKLFNTLPRTPYGIREVPDYIAPRTTAAYYMPPSGDGRNAGFYYVNTYKLDSRPLYSVEALSLHEAVPGHHLQLALQQEMEDLPEFRRYSRFTVFIEGWALYAERLGLEAGFYEDPYSDFGRLTYEMWRACRLVVDTGMHYLGWTRARAIEFMETNSALSKHNIRAEIDRYIAWPGQALAYKTGELKIRQLRQRAVERLGDRFDLRDFHDVLLGRGAVPLDVLESQVEAYIAAQQSKNRPAGE